MQVVCARGLDDFPGGFHLVLRKVAVGVQHVGHKAHDAHALILVLRRQLAQVRHLLDAGPAEGGPHVDHGQRVAGEDPLVHALAVQVRGGKRAHEALDVLRVLRVPGVLRRLGGGRLRGRGRRGRRGGLRRGRAGAQPQRQAKTEKNRSEGPKAMAHGKNLLNAAALWRPPRVWNQCRRGWDGLSRPDLERGPAYKDKRGRGERPLPLGRGGPSSPSERSPCLRCSPIA